ncbi:helix-turn-helix domain-containing protein [Petroclostridium sp. X23]|uniref:PucR family transcriptional regulator n=1 Tax=Petroclostridium sp. X23 TaxID=3045146 RepID=UPI0024AC8A77|nr:helix-turn-helix domain-containing protein [Petroclostridium sp. X23]WHH56809.1 helix-turn-helix domain-containing protein [Petroclostridium sp. X23]
MQRKYIEKIFNSLCNSFLETHITILDKNNRIVLSNTTENYKSLASESMEPIGGVFWNEKTQKYGVTLPLSDTHLLIIDAHYIHYDSALTVVNMANDIINLIKETEIILSKISLSQDNVTVLSNRLFNAKTPEDIAYIALWGVELGFDLSLSRTVCVLDIKTNELNTSLKESMHRSILYTLRTFTNSSSQDIAAPLNSNQIVLCKTLESNKISLRKQLYPYLSSLCSLLMDRHNISITVGVGMPPKNISEFGESLFEAQTALQYGQIFNSKQMISFISDYFLEFEISKIPQEELEHFLGRYIKILNSASHLLETIEALIINNMDINSTADYLFIHRNTAVFRINQIKKLFGLNPLHNDSDRFTLIMIYIYYKMMNQ